MNKIVLRMIETEYDEYCKDKSRNLDYMYALLADYLYWVISSMIKMNFGSGRDVAEELTQDVMLIISTDKIYTFKKTAAKFTTFCRAIAEKKAIDYIKKRKRHKNSSYEGIQADNFEFDGTKIYQNPEKLLLIQERKLEQIELLRKYLTCLMNRKEESYKTTACCYTLVLFHKYHPDSKMLSSPKWAYEEVEKETVKNSAMRFEREINEWFPTYQLAWGDAFLTRMEEQLKDEFVANVQYGKHFDTKDFENWSIRMRKKIKDELYEQMYISLEQEG